MLKRKLKRINLISIRKSMQTLFSIATTKCLLKSVKPNTKTSKWNLWPLKGKTKLHQVWKLWVRCSAVEKHRGFLESSKAKFPHINHKKLQWVAPVIVFIEIKETPHKPSWNWWFSSNSAVLSKWSTPKNYGLHLTNTASPGSCTYCSYCQLWPWNPILWFSAVEPPICLLLLGIC